MFIGKVVAAGDSIKCAPLKYTSLEVLRHDALQHNCGDYETILCLAERAHSLMDWWTTNITSCVRSLSTPGPGLVLTTDASMSG